MESNSNELAQLLSDVPLQALRQRSEDPFSHVKEVYQSDWDMVVDKPEAVSQSQQLGRRVGQHYATCRRPDCYWPKTMKTTWASPEFFIAMLETLFKESSNSDSQAIVASWRQLPVDKVSQDLRYVAFAGFYNATMAATFALKQQLIEP